MQKMTLRMEMKMKMVNDKDDEDGTSQNILMSYDYKLPNYKFESIIC